MKNNEWWKNERNIDKKYSANENYKKKRYLFSLAQCHNSLVPMSGLNTPSVACKANFLNIIPWQALYIKDRFRKREYKRKSFYNKKQQWKKKIDGQNKKFGSEKI